MRDDTIPSGSAVPEGVTVVIPTLNESAGIREVLRTLPLREMHEEGRCVRVLVVDGGSTDGTPEAAAAAGARVERAPRGYGSQYRAGFSLVSGGVVVTLDADGTYPSEQIPKLVRMLQEEDLDFLSVDRFANLEKGAMSGLHAFGNRVLTFWANRLFGLSLADSQSGMWVFRHSLLPRLRLTANGMAFSEEIKIEAFREARAREVGGGYRPRIGRAKIRSFRDGLGNLLFLFLKRLQRALEDRPPRPEDRPDRGGRPPLVARGVAERGTPGTGGGGGPVGRPPEGGA